jgi:zinc protease
MPALLLPADLPIERATLANGLRLVLHPDRRLPLVAVNLWYHVGSKNERPGRTGFAHLFEHMLFQGSQHVGTNEHFRHLQSVGGVANGSTWYDRTNYYETVPANELDLALWLESDRMGFLLPALDQRKLENQRDVVLNERRQSVDNRPYGRPYERLMELLFPDHPYGWPVIGRAEDIAAATLDDLHEFFTSWYIPRNAVLTLAGDFEPARARERVERWFGDLPPGSPPDRPAWAPPAPRGRILERVEDEVRLPRVYLAFTLPPYGHADWYAGALLAALLADGKSSPLYRDLVWERQIAQEVAAYVYPTEEAGIFVLFATARPGVEPEALAAALNDHLARAAHPAPEEELARARNRTLAALWSSFQTVDERADRLSMHATFFDDPAGAWCEPERYRAVTAEEVARVAARDLGADRGIELTVLARSVA